MQQIPLDLLTQDRFSATKYVVTERTRPIVDTLMHDGLNLTPFLFIVGSEGSGKSHLAHMTAISRDAQLINAKDDRNIDTAHLPNQSFIIDDADLFDQTTLFHLFNHTQKLGLMLMVTSKIHPLDWQYSVPDLSSRLNSMRILSLPQPDEALQSEILKKLFMDRLISPSTEFLDYLIKRCDRSVESMRTLVRDIELFANGRPFNRALARDFLDSSVDLPFDDF